MDWDLEILWFQKFDWKKIKQPNSQEIIGTTKDFITFPTPLEVILFIIMKLWLTLRLSSLLLLFRIWGTKAKSQIHQNTIQCSCFWQSYRRPSSQVCWSIVCYWRNNGTSHWILYHQWSRDCILCTQNGSWILP